MALKAQNTGFHLFFLFFRYELYGAFFSFWFFVSGVQTSVFCLDPLLLCCPFVTILCRTPFLPLDAFLVPIRLAMPRVSSNSIFDHSSWFSQNRPWYSRRSQIPQILDLRLGNKKLISSSIQFIPKFYCFLVCLYTVNWNNHQNSDGFLIL